MNFENLRPDFSSEVIFGSYGLHFPSKSPYMGRTDLYLLVQSPYTGRADPIFPEKDLKFGSQAMSVSEKTPYMGRQSSQFLKRVLIFES